MKPDDILKLIAKSFFADLHEDIQLLRAPTSVLVNSVRRYNWPVLNELALNPACTFPPALESRANIRKRAEVSKLRCYYRNCPCRRNRSALTIDRFDEDDVWTDAHALLRVVQAIPNDLTLRSTELGIGKRS